MMISLSADLFVWSLTTPLPISFLARYPFATKDTSTLTIATPWESTRLGSTARKPATAIAITPASTRDLAARVQFHDCVLSTGHGPQVRARTKADAGKA